jgi:hypothetical protein
MNYIPLLTSLKIELLYGILDIRKNYLCQTLNQSKQ